MPPVQPVFVVAVLLLAAVLAGKVSTRLGIPALLLFLGIGMAAGSEGPGGIEFADAELASSVGAVALAFILFSGGLDTRWETIRPVLLPGVSLATVGTLLTAAASGLGAALILDLPLTLGLLLGAIISSTDAAAVFSILRSRGVSLRSRLRALLELESGSNDPMAVFLTVALTTVLTVPDASWADLIGLFVMQMGIGGVLGVLMAKGAAWLINRIRLEYEGLYPVLTTAIVLTVYSATAALGGSGFLAVYLAGLVLARDRIIHKRSLMRFHDGLSWLAQIAMFLVLGLLVFPSQVREVALPGLAVAAVLMLVARPLAVWATLSWGSWSRRERHLVSWVGLRGAVPIILATFPVAEGVERSAVIFNTVFFVVILSVVLQGTTIPFVARRLDLEAPPETRPAGEREEIVGGGASGRSLSEVTIPEDSWSVGRAIVEIDLPRGVWLPLITREDEVLVPQGPTRLRAGDRVTVLANSDELHDVQRILRARKPPR